MSWICSQKHCPRRELDMLTVFNIYENLGESLPWPDTGRFDFRFKKPLISALGVDSRVHYLFDVNDSQHAFSNCFKAPIPLPGNLLAPCVRNTLYLVDVDEHCGTPGHLRRWVQTHGDVDEVKSKVEDIVASYRHPPCYCRRMVKVQAESILKKFLLHPALRDTLILTGDGIIVACSKEEERESSGLDKDDVLEGGRFEFQNTLGKTLMMVRDLFMKVGERNLEKTAIELKSRKVPGCVSNTGYVTARQLI